ncbi:MAG: FHA domain-containing protein [Gaiellales bacterium]
MTRIHCPECGFQNLEAASYCAKCGAYLLYDDPGQATMSFTPGRTDEAVAGSGDIPVEGTAILIRLGGRPVETFSIREERVTIGRSPDCDIFLDDVTVSRLHAVLEHEGAGCRLEDKDSLNGTFLNRRRVDTARLRDADEIQIGKYRLTFIDR